jgi:hypothetical protein
LFIDAAAGHVERDHRSGSDMRRSEREGHRASFIDLISVHRQRVRRLGCRLQHGLQFGPAPAVIDLASSSGAPSGSDGHALGEHAFQLEQAGVGARVGVDLAVDPVDESATRLERGYRWQ